MTQLNNNLLCNEYVDYSRMMMIIAIYGNKSKKSDPIRPLFTL